MTTDSIWLAFCGIVYDGVVAGDPVICTRDVHPVTEKHRNDTTGFEWW